MWVSTCRGKWTLTGTWLLKMCPTPPLMRPTPSCPLRLSPQANTPCPMVRASAKSPPPRTWAALTPDGSFTVTGMSLSVVLPLPSWPKAF